MERVTTPRVEALASLSRLLPSFADEGLASLLAAAKSKRLIRGVWKAGTAGCPLSCADGVVGLSRARRFFWQAEDRNCFVWAWDAGLVPLADVVAMVEIEIERRSARRSVPTLRGKLAGALVRLGAGLRPATA
ncbi:MAG: hypothetical protein U0556_12450 [Dehalococcoidia bacterium]